MARRATKADKPVQPEEQPLLPIKAPRRQPDRVGKRFISGQFDARIAKAVAHLAVNEDRTINSLLGEAIDDLLRKYDQPV